MNPIAEEILMHYGMPKETLLGVTLGVLVIALINVVEILLVA